jgi:hypothetical protein
MSIDGGQADAGLAGQPHDFATAIKGALQIVEESLNGTVRIPGGGEIVQHDGELPPLQGSQQIVIADGMFDPGRRELEQIGGQLSVFLTAQRDAQPDKGQDSIVTMVVFDGLLQQCLKQCHPG